MLGLPGLLVALVVPLLPAAPPDVPELKLSAEEAAPGDTVGVTGSGFAGCIPQGTTDTPESQPEDISVDPPPAPPPVILRWESLENPQELGEATLDDAGSFSTTIVVPLGAGAEPFYEVSAACRPGPGFDEIVESAVIVVVVPPPPPTTPPTALPTTPPTTTSRTSALSPTHEPPTDGPPTPVPTPDPDESAAPEVRSSGSDVLLAAFVVVLAAGLGLLGLTRAIRRRTRRHSRAASVMAVAAPAPPGLLDVRPRGPERTVALRVVMRVEPGVLSVHGSKE